jgi:hypothetical protein
MGGWRLRIHDDKTSKSALWANFLPLTTKFVACVFLIKGRMSFLRWLLPMSACLCLMIAAAVAQEKSDPTLGEELSYRAVLEHARVMREEVYTKC